MLFVSTGAEGGWRHIQSVFAAPTVKIWRDTMSRWLDREQNLGDGGPIPHCKTKTQDLTSETRELTSQSEMLSERGGRGNHA
jgi:hypothetical protein